MPKKRVDSILDEAVAKRKAASPAQKYPSEQVGKKVKEARSTFAGMPAPGGARPSREGYSFKPGSKADMAYTGVKPKSAAPRTRKPAPAAPAPRAAAPAPKPAPVAAKTPKRVVTPGRLFGIGVAVNAGQAAYYEYKRRKNQEKKK